MVLTGPVRPAQVRAAGGASRIGPVMVGPFKSAKQPPQPSGLLPGSFHLADGPDEVVGVSEVPNLEPALHRLEAGLAECVAVGRVGAVQARRLVRGGHGASSVSSGRIGPSQRSWPSAL